MKNHHMKLHVLLDEVDVGEATARVKRVLDNIIGYGSVVSVATDVPVQLLPDVERNAVLLRLSDMALVTLAAKSASIKIRGMFGSDYEDGTSKFHWADIGPGGSIIEWNPLDPARPDAMNLALQHELFVCHCFGEEKTVVYDPEHDHIFAAVHWPKICGVALKVREEGKQIASCRAITLAAAAMEYGCMTKADLIKMFPACFTEKEVQHAYEHWSI